MNDSSDPSGPSDRMKTGTNDSGDREDQDRWDRTLLYSSDPLAIATQRSISDPIVNRWSRPNDCSNNIKASLYSNQYFIIPSLQN